MRQVPSSEPTYLIIGRGRVAKHFHHYLSTLSLPVSLWHRSDSREQLQNLLTTATHVLLLIPDGAIDAFIQNELTNATQQLVHFSGSLISEKAIGAHPLMTFSNTLYETSLYPTIPFIIDDQALSFADLLPGLPNPHARLSISLKAKYHALCVLSGNFSCLLWQKLFTDMENELGLQASYALPYLMQCANNLKQSPHSALTGPLTRQDTKTIAANLNALSGDPYQQVYESFVSCFEQLKKVSS